MHLISLCKLFEGTRILKPEVRSSFVKNVTRILHFRVFLTFLTNLAINRVFGSQLECIAVTFAMFGSPVNKVDRVEGRISGGSR